MGNLLETIVFLTLTLSVIPACWFDLIFSLVMLTKHKHQAYPNNIVVNLSKKFNKKSILNFDNEYKYFILFCFISKYKTLLLKCMEFGSPCNQIWTSFGYLRFGPSRSVQSSKHHGIAKCLIWCALFSFENEFCWLEVQISTVWVSYVFPVYFQSHVPILLLLVGLNYQ